jgi:hypothetical protein
MELTGNQLHRALEIVRECLQQDEYVRDITMRAALRFIEGTPQPNFAFFVVYFSQPRHEAGSKRDLALTQIYCS